MAKLFRERILERGASSARISRVRYVMNPSIGGTMATKKPDAADDGVYRVIDVIGTSPVSWEEAAKNAVETAGGSVRDMRIAEVARLDVKIEGGRVVAYRARLQLSFKYESD